MLPPISLPAWILIIIFTLLPGLVIAQDSPQVVELTVANANRWFSNMDEKRYETGYELAGSLFHRTVKLNNWIGSLDAVRSNFGKVLNRKFVSHEYLPQAFEKTQGEFMKLTFITQFDQQPKPYLETVLMGHEGNSWLVEGYKLSPPPLTPAETTKLPRVTQDEPTETVVDMKNKHLKPVGEAKTVSGEGQDVTLPH